MIKSITYYFEDPSRLDEVSLQDLSAWVEEAPYSQPLHKLLDMKVKRSGRVISEVSYKNAAHHNSDIDLEKVGKVPKAVEAEVPTISETTVASIANTPSELLIEAIPEEDAVLSEIGPEQQDSLVRKKEHAKKKAKKAKLVAHEDASDEKEESVESEVMEEMSVAELHNSYIEQVVASNYDVANVVTDTWVAQKEIADDSAKPAKPAENAPKTAEEKPQIIKKALEPKQKQEQEKEQEEEEQEEEQEKYDSDSEDMAKEAALEVEASFGSEEQEAGVYVAAAEVDTHGPIMNPVCTRKNIDRKSKKGKSATKSKTSKKAPKSAKTKRTAVPTKAEKPIAEKVKYGYLAESKQDDFRIQKYEGESDYIKWLMQTKSTNKESIVADQKKNKKSKSKKSKTASLETAVDKSPGKPKKADKKKVKKTKKVKSEKKDVAKSQSKSAKPSKSKKKEKGKAIKQMVLKAAEESVKKRDIIMSETLADILAAQGHDKKAKKMYKQLSLIFPEKSSFFAAKIIKLKKK